MINTTGPDSDHAAIGLLRFGDELTIPTEIYRLAESFNSSAPEEDDFVLAPSDRTSEASNYYRHFKADLSLTRPQARTPDEEVWSMRTQSGDYTRLNEIVGQSDAGQRTYFNPLMAAKIFLSKVCRQSVERAREVFGHEEVRFRFTAPNFKYEGDGEEGKKKSRRYRTNLREIVGDILGNVEDVSFQVDGSDFLYEPYGVYYYYSLLEHSVNLDEAEAGNTYLVFDMGGSTTDVAVVQINRRESDFRLYPICTSIPSAGAYFDQYILKDFLGRSQVPRRTKKWSPYLDEIEDAKIALCEGREERVEIEIQEDEGGTFDLDRARIQRLLREIWRDKNQPLGPGFRGFLDRVQRLAREHGQLLEFDRIESVFLAGGSTGLPGLEDLIREDLEELGLLGSASEQVCVRPRRRLLSKNSTPNSSLAVLGQAASIAEESQERLLEEGEKVYAMVVGDGEQPYPFEREEKKDEEGGEDGEFLLCTVDELEERSTVRLEPGEDGAFEDVAVDDNYPLITEGDVYLRADVNSYSDQQSRRFKRWGGEKQLPADEEAPALQSRFTAHAELRPEELRVKPFLWNVDPRSDRRSTLEASGEGFLSVSLRPELPDDGAVHICVDLGMNNTAVAIGAAGRGIPPRADVEPLRLHRTPPEPASAVSTLLATRPMSKDEAAERVEEAHHLIGYQPRLNGLYRLVRGSCVRALQRHHDLADKGAAREMVEALDEIRSFAPVDVDVLERERAQASDLFRGAGTPEETLARAVDELRKAGSTPLTLRKIEKTVATLQEDSSRAGDDFPDSEGAGGPNDETATKNDTHDAGTEPTDLETTSMQDSTPGAEENVQRNGAPNPDGHWAVGMTQWIRGAMQEAIAPIQKSNRKTQEAVERVAEGLEGLVGDRTEEDGGKDVEIVQALEDIQETLSDISRPADGDEDSESRDQEEKVKAQIESRVQSGEGVLSRLAPGDRDRSLDAFQDFVEEKGFIYPTEVLRRAWMHCKSRASGLVILAGPPGCGKTSLVRLLAEFFNQDLSGDAWEQFHLLQPVSPSWFSPDSLLGSRSVMTGEYQYTSFLEFLIKAESHYMKALAGPGAEHARFFLACLDEFNIAQPEQYLADILSKMEAPPDSKDRRLHLGTDEAGGSAFDVDLTANFKLFATINTDSTTKTLSPKVLDRAIYIPVSPEIESLRRATGQFRDQFGTAEAFHERFGEVLDELCALSRAGQAPIAYRSIEQGYRYAASHPSADENAEAVLRDVLISFFLSKLPGAYAINDPEGTYREQLRNCEELRKFDEVDRLLGRIEEGLPGQAAL